MDNIEVGDYVRTKEGYIGKLVEYIPNALNYLKINVCIEIKHNDNMIDHFIYTRYGFQLKHSKNIIDLIEVRRLCEWKRSNKYYGWFCRRNNGNRTNKSYKNL